MQRTSLALAAGTLVAAVALRGVARAGLERGTPAGIAQAYLEAAEAVDLARLEAVAPAGMLEQRRRALGGALHRHVGQRFDKAVQAGAMRAYESFQAYEALKREVDREWRRLPYAERREIEDQGAWVADRVWQQLSELDRELARRDDDGGIRTMWQDIVEAGTPDWRKLSRWQQRRTDSAAFFAEHGGPRMPPAVRQQLEALGRERLGPDEQAALSEHAYADWLDAEAFSAEHGQRLLSEAYAARYQGCEGTIAVERPAPAGLLFTPGVATVLLQCASDRSIASAAQGSEGWRLTLVDDIDVDQLVRQLESTGRMD